MAATKIFLTGASGYIGGSVLSTLLKYPNKYTITALVRNKDQADGLRKLGVRPIVGTLEDLELLSQLAVDSDAVVHTAHADHLPSAQALVRGLQAKKNKRAVLVHTSGTGLLTFSRGATEIPFDDLDMERIHSIPVTAPHKDVDSWIFENTGDITAAIIAPSTINGIGTGPFKKTSQQIPNLVRAAVARKQAGWVGERKNVVWGNVNIHDLAELYRIILDGLLSNTIVSGKEGGWYFGSAHEHTWVQVAEETGKVLKKFGLAETENASQFQKAFVDKYLGGDDATIYWVGDSRCVANRSRQIGWNPTHPTAYETLEQEIKYLIENGELQHPTKH